MMKIESHFVPTISIWRYSPTKVSNSAFFTSYTFFFASCSPCSLFPSSAILFIAWQYFW